MIIRSPINPPSSRYVLGLFSVALLASAVADQSMGARYRYTSSALYADSFLSGDPIVLEYISESNGNLSQSVTWTSDNDDCTISLDTTRQGHLANLSCSEAGDKRINLIRSDQQPVATDSFYISLDSVSSTGCYDWFVVLFDPTAPVPRPLPQLPPAAGPFELRLWIFDHSTAVDAEASGSALVPSAPSQQISLEYFSAGEAPSIAVLSSANALTVLGDPVFNASAGYWSTFVTTGAVQSFTLSLSSQGISIFDCRVGASARSFVIYRFSSALPSPSSPPPPPDAVADALTRRGFQYLPMRSDACVSSTAVIPLPDLNGFFVTESGFESSSFATLSAFPFVGADGSALGSVGSLIDVALTPDSMVLLTNTSVFHILTNSSTGSFSFQQAVGIPAGTRLDRVQSMTTCDVLLDRDYSSSPINQFVAAWHSTNGSFVFVSLDAGASYTPLPLPSELGPFSRVYNLQWQTNRYRLLVLARGPSGVTALLMDGYTKQWRRGALFTGALELDGGYKNSTPSFVVPASGSGEVFFYGDSLLYSSDGGSTADAVELRTRDPVSFGSASLGPSESILQLTTSAPGLFAAVTSLRRVFIGSAGLRYAVEVQSGERPSSLFTLFYDPLLSGPYNSVDPSLLDLEAIMTGVQSASVAQLVLVQSITADPSQQLGKWRVLTLGANSSSSSGAARVQSRLLPVQNEVTAPAIPESQNKPAVCPYLTRDDSSLPPIQYLDMGRTLSVNLSLVADVRLRNTISVAVSDTSLVAFQSTVSSTSAAAGTNLVVRTRSVTFSESPGTYANRSDRLLRATGRTDIRAVSSVSGLPCEFSPALAPLQRVSHVRVGCPPGRHIRVRPPVAGMTCGQSHGIGPFGTAPEYQHLDDSQYSAELYGCPFSLYHQADTFNPIIDLYDGDQFVEIVPADFIVWEATGRTDFTYLITQGAAGCTSAAQTWAAMRAKSSDDYSAWTPENYRSCFTSDPTGQYPLTSPNQMYEVINYSNPNAISFPLSGKDGLFLFKLRVVNPSYSFCDLSARFAVSVYGAPITFETSMIVVGSSIAVMVTLLTASYFHYRNKMVMKKNN